MTGQKLNKLLKELQDYKENHGDELRKESVEEYDELCFTIIRLQGKINPDAANQQLKKATW